MKAIKKLAFGARGALALALMFQSQITQAAPFGSAFTYQGRLNSSGAPATNGLYDFRFTLNDAATLGSPVGSAVPVDAVPVTNGLFTVPLDFGATAFTSGEARWLQLQVNASGLTPLIALDPRQRLTPAPQAIYAGSAAAAATASSVAAGAVTSAGLAPGSVGSAAIADGSITSADLNATLLNNTFWKLGGNAGTTNFLGTTDYRPLDFKVNNQRALRLEPTVSEDTVNVIGGSSRNVTGAGAEGATIGGGGTGEFQGSIYPNQVDASFGTVSGGAANTIRSNALFATVGGGGGNLIQSNAYFATIPGGANNSAADYAFAAGNRAKANHTGAFVWADSTPADFATTASNQFLIRAGGNVGINKNNPATALDVNGAVTAGAFLGSGVGLTNLNAASLTGSVPSAALTSLPATSLTGTILDARLSANVALLTGSQTFTGAKTFSSEVVAGGGVRLNDTNLWLRGGGDINHGLGWYGNGRPFAGNAVNGPVLFGYSGGALGTEQFGTERIALFWNSLGHVNVDPASANNGAIVDQPALAFGDANSGEGIASKRTGGGNQWGLDFYTGYQNRMSIANNGKIGIGTTTPATALDVNGTVTATSFSGSGNQPLEFKVNGTRTLRLEPTASTDTVNVVAGSALNAVGIGVVGATIGGGGAGDYGGVAYSNRVEADFGTVSGGIQNTIQPNAGPATISGGYENSIQPNAGFATIGGGALNMIQTNSGYGTIGGGVLNVIQMNTIWATIGGGAINMIQTNSPYAIIGGGFGNAIQSNARLATISGGGENMVKPNAAYATIGGGYLNQATNNFATVPGGAGNTAGGQFSFAAGHDAKALHDGAFVWADSPAGGFASTADNQFLIRAAGGVGIGTATPATALQVIGTVTATAFNPLSDRNLKENFAPVTPREVLDKVAALPITQWNFKGDTGTPHLGPMAQDFYAAFNLGTDDKRIATVDADGVALAAIQGLNQKLETEGKAKDARITALEQRLSALETLLQK